MVDATLNQLEEQEKQLKAKLMGVRKSIEEKRNRVNIAIGAAVLAEADANPSYKTKLMKVLDKQVKGKRDRSMLGLEGSRQREGDHEVTGD